MSDLQGKVSYNLNVFETPTFDVNAVSPPIQKVNVRLSLPTHAP